MIESCNGFGAAKRNWVEKFKHAENMLQPNHLDYYIQCKTIIRQLDNYINKKNEKHVKRLF